MAPPTAISPRSAWRSCSGSPCCANCAAAAASSMASPNPDHRPARHRRARHRRRCRRLEEPQPRLRDAGPQGDGRASQHRARRAGRGRAPGQERRPAATSVSRSGPRINAGGRVGKSDLGVRLLTATDPEEARAIAAELDRLNEERRAIEQIVDRAGRASRRWPRPTQPLIIVSGTGWHPGVVGIVASRLKERFDRPAIVIAVDEDGIGKGSGRSISGVDLGAAILAAKDSGLLVAGGGHAMAAGVTVAPGGDRAAARLPPRAPGRARSRRRVAGRALLARRACSRPAGSRASLCDALDAGGPYGAGWPAPRCRRRARAADQARRSSATAMSAALRRATTARASSWIAFRAADTPLGPGLARLPLPTRAGGLPGRSSATNGLAAMPRKCTSRTPPSLDRMSARFA